jgi:hypothetical protein
MPQYIRAFVPGGTFFYTVTLLERRREMDNVKGGMRYAFPPYGLGDETKSNIGSVSRAILGA